MCFSKKIIIPILSLALSVSTGDAVAQQTIIPMPQVLQTGTGNFVFNSNTLIRTDGTEQPALAYFREQLLRTGRIKNRVAIDTKATTAGRSELLVTSRGAEDLPAEGYRLTVTPSGIRLIGKGAGLFYGLQTLLQLLPASANGSAVIPCVAIEDAPRFRYRGLMLDVSRHFFTVEQVKDLLDLMARYKLNRFHWHLTDDQGWRLEIKSYPELTRVGAWRVPRIEFSGNTLPPQPGEKATDGGFYTQEQVKEVIRYAADRHIEILPEIDVPGHSMAAIAAYPELCVTRDTSIKVSPGSSFAKWFPGGGYEMYVDNSLNPTSEKVYEFLDKVFGEVAALFPYPYIHIGGDECFKGFWEKDPAVKRFMEQHQIKDAHELQGYFISRLNKIILSKNKKLIGWDEITEGNLKDNVAVMNRFGEKGAKEQTEKGMDIVLAPGGNGLYFDYAQSASDQEPSSHGGDAPAWKAYEYNPEYPSLSADQRKHIMGVEGCVWTENIPGISKLQYMILPRMLALAETAWTNPGKKDYRRFAQTALPAHLADFDRKGMNYRVPTGFSYIDTTITTEQFTLTIPQTPVPGSKVFFTLNNRPPGDFDHEYKGPVTIDVPKGKSIPLKTIVITPAGRRSIITRTLLDNSDKQKK
ncbi:hexosaminidase [Chitinophaga terrae (ex Kim and Jung 2007)]|uniref:beta-N-acetylhexosaminidase n=1 Tax=Chitinophaga terrae (ex Kim and Jung 2007) TaxID=408074 RepID=UPI0027895C6E|nr:beta-N-acetylhexosaminidase [Chitinophaga terrae (ex Kim and Jung 2007)]MDQ0109002.1 hexosaminidase [Chitinophaga terrae (ex Kim and Jung 2007)]